MNLRHMMHIVLLILGVGIGLEQPAGAQTKLGLHITQEELAIWKQRAASGPYKTAGDVSTNSPGDWSRILNQANTFLSNPSAERWKGQTVAMCWQPKNSPALPGRSRGEKLRDAGFVYLITGDVKYRDAVRTELLAQAAEAGTNFADGNHWCNDPPIGGAYSYEIVMWLTKLIFGYDYIRASLSTATRNKLDEWFHDAGIFWEDVVAEVIETRFPNRNINDYTILGPGWHPNRTVCSHGNCLTHYNGWNKYDWHEGWNNRNATQICFVAMVGLLTNDMFLKNQAKRYFKEWLTYAVFPDGTDSDFHRWADDFPTKGFGYAGSMIGSMVTIADHFARDGDFTLYEYITSEGIGTMTPAGGPKSLKQVVILYMQHINHSVVRYGTDDPTKYGNPEYLIDSEHEAKNWHSIGDVWMAPANVYFKDTFIKSIYKRTAPNTPSYPRTPASGGFQPWQGEWGINPGILFMFGDMEGKVWPYAGKELGPPKNFKVIGSSS